MSRSPFHSGSQTIAAALRVDRRNLDQHPVRDVPAPMRLGYDADRESRLNGICDGIVHDVASASRLEQRIGDLRQASANGVSFRQALFLLMQVENIAPEGRVELMRRAMQWYRARAMASGQGGSLWAKSFLSVAVGQAGRLSK